MNRTIYTTNLNDCSDPINRFGGSFSNQFSRHHPRNIVRICTLVYTHFREPQLQFFFPDILSPRPINIRRCPSKPRMFIINKSLRRQLIDFVPTLILSVYVIRNHLIPCLRPDLQVNKYNGGALAPNYILDLNPLLYDRDMEGEALAHTFLQPCIQCVHIRMCVTSTRFPPSVPEYSSGDCHPQKSLARNKLNQSTCSEIGNIPHNVFKPSIKRGKNQ